MCMLKGLVFDPNKNILYITPHAKLWYLTQEILAHITHCIIFPKIFIQVVRYIANDQVTFSCGHKQWRKQQQRQEHWRMVHSGTASVVETRPCTQNLGLKTVVMVAINGPREVKSSIELQRCACARPARRRPCACAIGARSLYCAVKRSVQHKRERAQY